MLNKMSSQQIQIQKKERKIKSNQTKKAQIYNNQIFHRCFRKRFAKTTQIVVYSNLFILIRIIIICFPIGLANLLCDLIFAQSHKFTK